MRKYLRLLNSALLLAIAYIPLVSQAQVTQATVAAYDCSVQSQIPTAECNALKDLFASTAGESWTDNSNWGTGNPGNWAGVALIGVAPNQHVNSLSMDNNNLTGSLNSSLANLTELQQLNFSQNSLTGPIPASFSTLTNMRRLFLFNNQLNGGIPDVFGGWSNVLLISLAENPGLGGSIPNSLGSNNSIERIFLQNTGLTGSIPGNLGDLTNLSLIDLSNNQLTGAIPLSFGNDPATPATANFSNNQLDADGTGVALTPGALAAWAASGIQRALNDQAASAGPTAVQVSSVPASPLWSLMIMSLALFFAQRTKNSSKP